MKTVIGSDIIVQDQAAWGAFDKIRFYHGYILNSSSRHLAICTWGGDGGVSGR